MYKNKNLKRQSTGWSPIWGTAVEGWSPGRVASDPGEPRTQDMYVKASQGSAIGLLGNLPRERAPGAPSEYIQVHSSVGLRASASLEFTSTSYLETWQP